MPESARERLLKQFRELVMERLSRISRAVMALEEAPGREVGRNVLRELHGLKGEARMMGFADINAIVHEMEELVRAVEAGDFALGGGSADALLVAADAVMALSGAVQAAGPPPEVSKVVETLRQRLAAEHQARSRSAAPGEAPAAPPTLPPLPPQTPTRPPAAPPAGAEVKGSGSSEGTRKQGTLDAAPATRPPLPPQVATRPPAEPSAGAGGKGPQPGAGASPPVDPRAEGVRIGSQSLDVLTTAVTNLSQVARRRELAASRRLQLARELAKIARAAEDLGPAAAALASRLTRAKEVAAELHREAKLLANEELRDLTQMVEEVQALRMLPLAVLFELYPRMVRDLSRELGKEVELVIEGESTRADRTVVEALREPLMHLVRNALDHGLEDRAQRVSAGKLPRGRLLLRASREGDRVLVRVEDDGAGLDLAAIRQAAVRKGFLDEATAYALSDQAARELIFLPGFSSREVATDVSGRGLGLDVVRVRLQALGGDVVLRSEPGLGTSVELSVPVSLTVAPLLFIQAGEERLCLTASNVVHALKVEKEQVREVAGRAAIKVQDEVLPFASISSILGSAPKRPPGEGELVLLVRGQGGTAAISVDRVLDQRVQPVLPLKGMLSRFAHLSGATSLADGSLAMVLSAGYLVSSARGMSSVRLSQAARPAEPRKRRILIVDDSPLTRELLSSLLEAVGYEIASAADGLEAFERLGKEAVDLVVTDLEMPRMDGLELTRRLKSHGTLRSLPVVIITTRGTEADRRRGMEAGADGYIAKGDLVRQDLVDVVARLLG